MKKENKGIMAEKCNRSDFANLVPSFGWWGKEKSLEAVLWKTTNVEFPWCEDYHSCDGWKFH